MHPDRAPRSASSSRKSGCAWPHSGCPQTHALLPPRSTSQGALKALPRPALVLAAAFANPKEKHDKAKPQFHTLGALQAVPLARRNTVLFHTWSPLMEQVQHTAHPSHRDTTCSTASAGCHLFVFPVNSVQCLCRLQPLCIPSGRLTAAHRQHASAVGHPQVGQGGVQAGEAGPHGRQWVRAQVHHPRQRRRRVDQRRQPLLLKHHRYDDLRRAWRAHLGVRCSLLAMSPLAHGQRSV